MKHAKGKNVDYQEKHTNLPYTAVVDQPRLMKGGEMPTVFGVLGMTKMDAPSRSLGGLVHNPRPDAPVPDLKRSGKMMVHTERSICGPSKTHINGHHYGQVPYAGAYMSPLGPKL